MLLLDRLYLALENCFYSSRRSLAITKQLFFVSVTLKHYRPKYTTYYGIKSCVFVTTCYSMGISLVLELRQLIFFKCSSLIFHRFSAVRKCTNEGRALMQLDLRHFQVKVDGLTRLRPLPDASIVETFIKAYYLPESALEKWIQEQTVTITFDINS